MPSTVRDLLSDMVSPGPAQQEFAVPSHYRHLTEWPAWLAVVKVALRPSFRNGGVAAAAQALRARLAIEAEGLAAVLPPLPIMAATPTAHDAAKRFAGKLIPEIVIIGHSLDRALDAGKAWGVPADGAATKCYANLR